MTPARARAHRLAALCAALLATLAMTGCGGKDDDVKTTTDHPVCGLVDPQLAAEVVGSREFDTTGPGAIPRSDRESTGAHCTIRRASGAGPIIQVRLGEVSESTDHWRKQLEQEAASLKCDLKYTDDPGYGYACDYETGIYALGAGVHVLKGDRIVRVIAYQWPDVSAAHRLAVVEDIARNADANLTAYDAAHH